ncbi:glycine zipper 2TM domain-containing protein [Neisseria sp.]|uniref:glycine zipper 2TM domain-containing protein n=1 Tax=Neisseria sp. TaxID=192066 RepID=UPI0035A186D0
MKSMIVKTVALLAVAGSLTACESMTRTQRNAAIGAGIGGLAGHAIGGNTGSTLGGAALGGVIGSQIRR